VKRNAIDLIGKTRVHVTLVIIGEFGGPKPTFFKVKPAVPVQKSYTNNLDIRLTHYFSIAKWLSSSPASSVPLPNPTPSLRGIEHLWQSIHSSSSAFPSLQLW
jgi:hypothetical protein